MPRCRFALSSTDHLSPQGRFLWTSPFFFLQYRATKVLQLRDPSTASDAGKEAYLQLRSQKSTPASGRISLASGTLPSLLYLP